MKLMSCYAVATALQLAAVTSPALAADRVTTEAASDRRAAAVRDVAATTQAFYRALHDHDRAAIDRYVSPEGFSEFPGSGGPLLQKTVDTLQQVIARGTVVDVRLEDLRIDLLSPEVALVTGYRTGVVGASASVAPQKRRMSLLWVRHGDQWQLAHAHFSASE